MVMVLMVLLPEKVDQLLLSAPLVPHIPHVPHSPIGTWLRRGRWPAWPSPLPGDGTAGRRRRQATRTAPLPGAGSARTATPSAWAQPPAGQVSGGTAAPSGRKSSGTA